MSEFHSFLRLNNILLNVYTMFCLSTHLSMDSYVASTLAIVNNAAINMSLQISVPVLAFTYLVKYQEVKLLDHMVTLFLIFLRKHHTLFHTGSTILHSHQQCTSSPHSHEHVLVFLCLLYKRHSNGCEVVFMWAILVNFFRTTLPG